MSFVAHRRIPPVGGRPVVGVLIAALLTAPLVALVSFGTATSPATTLAALVAIAVVVVLLLRIEAALLVLVAAGALEEAFQISSNPQITITKIAGAICFASFARYALTSRRKLVLDASHGVVIGILLLALASTPQAFDTSAAVTTATRYASFVALYVVVSQFVDAHRLHRQIAWVLTLASAAAAVIGLRSYFAGDSVVATLPYANPSDFAFILATTLPLAFWLLGSTRRLRVPLAVVIALIGVATTLSLSRGTMVGLAAGLAWLVIVDRRHVRVVLAGGLLSLLVAFLVIRSDPSRFETALLYKKKVADYNVTTRYEAWWAAADLAVEKPLLGVGPGNFRFYFNEKSGRPAGTHNLYVAHNAYLDMAAELGVGGMLLFLAYLGMIMHRLGVAARRGLGLPGYARALRISLVVAIVSAFFLSEQYYPPFWLIGGLATAIYVEGARRKRPVPELPVVERRSVAAATEYDPAVLERLDEREGRIKAHFRAIRLQQERLRERATKIAELEEQVLRRQLALADAERLHDEAKVRTEGRTRALKRQEAEIARRLNEVSEAAIAARERELERFAGASPASAPSDQEQPVAPARPAADGWAAKEWNIFWLEREVAKHAGAHPELAEEWRAYLVPLGSYADMDGWLPDIFDPLVREIFGELTEDS